MISIELILLGVIAVIMFISIITGLCQGFRKSMFKLVATIIFWIIFWVTAPLIKGKFIWYGEEFYQLIAPMLDGTQYANLMEYVLAMIASLLNMDAATLADPAIENTFIAVAMCIIKIVYLILLAIVYGIVRKIVYKVKFKEICKIDKGVVRKLERKQRRYVKKHGQQDLKLALTIESKKEKLKKNKIYRPLGMVSGLARGCLTSFLILCLINSTVRLLPENNKQEDVTASTNSYESTPSIYDFILEFTGNDPTVKMAVELINEYQSSTLMNITGIKIGARTADELFIDSILSGKSEDYSFAIRKELQSIVTIAEEAFYLTNGFDMESVNWTALNNAQVTSIQNILTILSDDDLINNLGSVMVGIAISLDAVAEFMPENLSSVEYENIDWAGELATIADLVASVYSLGDLSNLDFLNLDETIVEEIIVTLSELESINFLGHVGANFAIKSLVGDSEEYGETIAVIEQKLADLAVNNGYSDTVYAYKDLYADFIEIFQSDALNQYKDENGQITNYVSALTSVDTEKYSNIVSTILEANFVNEILPDVLTIIKEEFIPEEYSSLINPGIVTTSQWEEEINAAFTIINSITDKGAHPFDTIETFDFALLSNFSTETVVKSDLLSYAMIKIFVDTSKSEGILAESTEGLGDFISVPDTLAAPANPTTHKFADKWYGSESLGYENGELFIMLDTVKNCASQLENLNNPEGSLPAILAAIDGDKIVQSEVLYYSLNKMVDQVNEYIIVPVSETSRSGDTVNGDYVDRMINRESLKEVLNVFTDSNIVDLESLLSYYKVLDDGSLAEEPTDKKDITNVKDYQAKFDMSTENILGLLTSKKLYDSETGNDENLNKLFNSQILRATVSNLLNEFAGEYIAIPDRSSTEVDCYVLSGEEEDEEREIVVDTVKVVNKKDFKSLIMAVSDLDLDLASMMDDPMSVIDSFKDDDGLKDEAKALFEDANSSKYSGILHATISKYVIEFSEEGGEGLAIVVPSEVLDSSDSSLITCSETVNLLESLVIIGTDVLTNSEMSEEEMINSVINNVINNENSLNSTIIRATLTSFIASEDTGLTVPEEALDGTISSKDVANVKDVRDLLTAIKAMKDVKNESLPESEQIDYYDLLDVENIEVSMLSTADGKPNNPISSSLILRGIVTDQLEQNDIVVPEEAKDGTVISKNESIALIGALCDILGEESSITNINIDELTVGEFVDAKDKIASSKIIRKLVTDELEKQEDILVPSLAYDDAITSTTVISENEVKELIDGLGNILGTSDKITSINLDSITTAKLQTAKTNIKNSYVLNATIANQLNAQSDVAVPSNAYENENEKILLGSEIDNLIDGLVNLLGSEANVTNIDVNNIKTSDIKNSKGNIQGSIILNATITKQLDGQSDVVVPSKAYKSETEEIKELTDEEISNLIDGLVALLGSDATVSNIDVNNIKASNMKTAIVNIQGSSILNATITKQLDQQSDVSVPTHSYVDKNATNKKLKDAEIESLINGLVDLLGADATVTNIDVNDITAEKMEIALVNIKVSSILNATITKQLLGQESVVVPSYAYADSTADVKQLDETEMEQLILGLVKLVGKDATVTNIDVDNIKAKNLKLAANNIKESGVLRATITKQIDENENVVVPEYSYDGRYAYREIYGDDLVDLIEGLVSLLGEDALLTNINVDNIKAKDMKDSKDEIVASSILRATITDKLAEQDDVVVPTLAYESGVVTKVLTASEMSNLILGLVKLVGEDSVVTNIDVNTIKVSNMEDAKEEIKASNVLNATVTKQLDKQSTVKVPVESYIEDGDSSNRLKGNEIDNLIGGLAKLLGSDTNVNSINVENVTIGEVKDSREFIKGSKILNATIAYQIEENDEVSSPDSAFVDSSVANKILTDNEIDNLLVGLNNLLGSSTRINSIEVSTITIKNIQSAKVQISNSHILNATITKQIDGQEENLVVPVETYEDSTSSIKELKVEQMISLIDGITKLLDENAAVNNINVNGLSLSKVSDASGEINDSFILRSTITKHIKSNNSIVVPSVSYDDNLKNKVALSENEISSLINTLISLFGSNRTINDLPVNELTVGKLYESVDELVGSYVLKATITDNLKDKEEDHTIVIPSASYDEYEILTDTEIDKLFASLDCLFKEQRISAISSFSGIAINKINDNSDLFADSYVIRSTISKELLNANDVVIPQNSIDSSVVDYQLLTKAELKEFFAAIATMGISDISNINANEIKVDKDKTNTLVASDIMRATITKNVNINNKAIYALTSSVDKTVDVDGNDILVLNEAEVSAMIGSLNVLSASGSISVNFDINLLKALSLEDLSNLLNSNSVRIAVSELLDVILSPTSIEEVYKLPNSTIKEDKSTFTKQEIINIISLLI